MAQYTSGISPDEAAIMSDHANQIVDEIVEVYDREVDAALFISAGIAACVLASAGIQTVTLNVPGIGQVTMSVNRDANTEGVLH